MNPSRKTPPNQWKAGQSGNPKGRPPGVSAVTKMRQSLSGDVPEILAGLVAAAKGGDVQAARLILERVLPPLKGVELPVTLSLPDGGTLTAKANAMLVAAANGDLAPGQAAQLISALGSMAKIAEIDDLSARITKLEAHHGNT
jgi:hypothetical protein